MEDNRSGPLRGHAAFDLDCVIPAAGIGTRMRGYGPVKPVVQLHGKPLIRHAVEHALTVCRRCVVVTGHGRTAVVAALDGLPGVHLVHNPHYQSGMFSSIRVGAEAVESNWFFVCPADMPLLTPWIFEQVLQGAGITPATITHVEEGFPGDGSFCSVFPEYRGRRGHPVLISRAVVPAMRRESADGRSMKAFLQQWPVKTVLVESDAIFLDLDTPETLEAEHRRGADGDHH